MQIPLILSIDDTQTGGLVCMVGGEDRGKTAMLGQATEATNPMRSGDRHTDKQGASRAGVYAVPAWIQIGLWLIPVVIIALLVLAIWQFMTVGTSVRCPWLAVGGTCIVLIASIGIAVNCSKRWCFRESGITERLLWNERTIAWDSIDKVHCERHVMAGKVVTVKAGRTAFRISVAVRGMSQMIERLRAHGYDLDGRASSNSSKAGE
jgi:hypothetical protein